MKHFFYPSKSSIEGQTGLGVINAKFYYSKHPSIDADAKKSHLTRSIRSGYSVMMTLSDYVQWERIVSGQRPRSRRQALARSGKTLGRAAESSIRNQFNLDQDQFDSMRCSIGGGGGEILAHQRLKSKQH